MKDYLVTLPTTDLKKLNKLTLKKHTSSNEFKLFLI